MAAAAGGPARAQALRDLFRDLTPGQVGREQAGRRDGAGRARAVGDHHGAAQTEQDSSPVALGVEPRGELPQPAANRIAPSSVFSATFPVKPSVTITSTSPASRSPPSTLPAKLSGSAPCGG